MRILILRVSSIGDVVHTLPSLFLIKSSIPQCKISWVVQEKAAPLLKNQPFLEHLWVLHNRYLSPVRYLKTIPILKQIRSIHWDAIIDFQGILKTSTILTLIPGKKYGFDKHHARSKVSTLFTQHHTTPSYQNIIQKNLALTSDVISDICNTHSCPAISELKKSFKLYIPNTNKKTVSSWIKNNNIKKLIILCPNTTWPSKHWPLERWKELVTILSNHKHTPSLILVGKDFGLAAFKLATYIKQRKLAVHILPSWNLLTISHLISQSALVIAPDTGLLHIADFLRTQSIGIFGPTNKKKHGPFLCTRSMQNAFQVACPHFYQKKHKKRGLYGILSKDLNCMSNLTADAVFKKIKDILSF